MSRMHIHILPVMLLLCLAASACAATATHTERQLGATTAPYGFLEYLPAAYYDDPTADFPVVVFLHGLGEKGNGTTELWGKITAHGPHNMIKNGSTLFDDNDCIVLSPQSSVWWNVGTLDDFFDYIFANYRIDSKRVYLTGLSMGGGGTWAYVKNYGERITACVPICGAAGGSTATKFLDTPTWAFHSWGDGTVTRNNSINWCNNIADVVIGTDAPNCLDNYPHAGGDTTKPAAETKTGHYTVSGGWVWDSGVTSSNVSQPKLTLYTDNSHNSWTRTYNNMTMWTWLFAQSISSSSDPTAVISSPATTTVIDAGVSINFSGSATDPEDGTLTGSALEWRSNLDGVLGTGTSISTSALSVGTHSITLNATDGDGRSGSDSVTVTILYNGTFNVVVDFGASGTTTAGNYNNITNTSSGSVAGAVDVTGIATSTSISITDTFAGTNSNGVVASDLFPEAAQQDSMWLDPGGDSHAEVTVSGLSADYEYDFIFFASRTATNNRTTDYTINGTTVSLNAANNTSGTVTIANVSPDGSGSVVIEIDVAAGAVYGYLGVLQIIAHDPGSGAGDPPAITHKSFVLSGHAESNVTLIKIDGQSAVPAGDGSFSISVPCSNSGGDYTLQLYDSSGLLLERSINLDNTSVLSL